MENQPPSTTANAWLNRRPATTDERDSEITKLKEKLGFYESFDQIIQDNVARAGELLRHAATMRENAEESLAVAKQELEVSRVAERQDFRSLLSGLLDDVSTMQVQIERLARKVADALDDVELSLPTSVDVDRLPSDLPAPIPAIAADTGSEPWSSLTLDPTPDEIGPAVTLDTEAAAMGTAASAMADEPFEIEADIAAAEATELNETAEYLAVESVASQEETSESVAAEPELDSVASQEETSESVAAEPELDDEGSEIETPTGSIKAADAGWLEAIRAEQGPVLSDVESPESGEESIVDGAALDDTARPESYESDAIAAEAAGADEPAAELDEAQEDELLKEDASAPADIVASSESVPAFESALPDAEVQAEPSPEMAAAPKELVDEPIASAVEPPVSRAGIRPFPSGGLGSTLPRPGTGELRNQEPARSTPLTMGALGTRGVATVVLVHGVPRATTALSLKRFLESLPHVASVEPREYAEGVLRLHVTAQRPVLIDDLRGWSDGAGFEPVHLREDLVEVRLPH